MAETARIGSQASSEPEVLGRFPLLVDHLVATVYPDGKPRETGTVLFFSEMGVWKAAVMDRHAGMTAFVTGKTFQELLEAVERGLDEDRLDWRPARKQVPRR